MLHLGVAGRFETLAQGADRHIFGLGCGHLLAGSIRDLRVTNGRVLAHQRA